MTPEHARAARELIAFYLDSGVDALVGEEPLDRFAGGEVREETVRPQPSATIVVTTAARPVGFATSSSPPPSPEAAVMAARAAAKGAASLDALRAILDGFDGCAL